MLLWREKGRSPSHQEGQGLPVEEEDLKKMGWWWREEQVGYWSEAEPRAKSWPGASWVKAGWMVGVRLQVV